MLENSQTLCRGIKKKSLDVQGGIRDNSHQEREKPGGKELKFRGKPTNDLGMCKEKEGAKKPCTHTTFERSIVVTVGFSGKKTQTAGGKRKRISE